MEIILEDEGIQLGKMDYKYYLIFDSGELAVQMKELQITDEEASQVKDNPDCAYDIIIAYQNKEMFGK
jgi:hypothetical protein